MSSNGVERHISNFKYCQIFKLSLTARFKIIFSKRRQALSNVVIRGQTSQTL